MINPIKAGPPDHPFAACAEEGSPPEPEGAATSRWKEYLAIGLVSAAVMLFEVAIIRILSVVLWYHFAFLAVSLAMLGLGVPGVWHTLALGRQGSLPRSLLLSAAAIPVSLAVLFHLGDKLPFRPALATVCILVPMIALGNAVCLLLLKAQGRRIGRMYAADLLGATVGALSVVSLMHVFPTPLIIAATGFLPLAAFFVIADRRRGVGLILALALLGALIWQEPFRLHFTKAFREPPDLVYEKWTPTARLSFYSKIWWRDEPSRAFGWGMGSRYPPRPSEQMWIEQDGSAGTPIARFQGSLEDLEYLPYDVTSAAFQIRPPGNVCIIGAGGGRDILAALQAGARQVDAVELNPHLVDIVSKRFGSYSGDVYHLPKVRAVISEGRSFLSAADKPYDLIQISLIDSWAATAAGAYALSENFLYTVEAYRLNWQRLSPEGMISTSRWFFGERQLEMIRLVFLVEEALRAEGVADPRSHLAILQAGPVGTLLIFKRPLDPATLLTIDTVCIRRGFARLWPPLDEQAASLPAIAGLISGPRHFEKMGLNLSPPTDDQPFFFQNVPIFGRIDRALIQKLSVNEEAVVILRQLMTLVSLLAVTLFFLPFILRGKMRRHPGFWRGSGYFALIGLAFMLVEIPLIQRTILYLGHPSHATTVILSSMLLGAAGGSLLAARTSMAFVQRWGFFPALVTASGSFALRFVFEGTLDWSFGTRALLTFAVAGGIGFFVGFAFPVGMVRFDERHKAWFWAVNGAASVLASVFALALSMYFGFTAAMYLGAGLYFVAWLFAGSSRGAAAP